MDARGRPAGQPGDAGGCGDLVDLLPEGDWVDVWTGEWHQGDLVVERDVPIDEVPVYCRAQAWESRKAIFTPTPA